MSVPRRRVSLFNRLKGKVVLRKAIAPDIHRYKLQELSDLQKFQTNEREALKQLLIKWEKEPSEALRFRPDQT